MEANTALKVAIVSSGHRQYVIAGRAGMNETLLSKIITGRTTATPEQKKALAKALGRRVQDLFPEAA